MAFEQCCYPRRITNSLLEPFRLVIITYRSFHVVLMSLIGVAEVEVCACASACAGRSSAFLTLKFGLCCASEISSRLVLP